MRIARWLFAGTTILLGAGAVALLARLGTQRTRADGAAALAAAFAFGAQSASLARARWARALRWAEDAVGWGCVLLCFAPLREDLVAVLALGGPLLAAAAELLVGARAAAAVRADVFDCTPHPDPATHAAHVAVTLDSGAAAWGLLHAAALGARAAAFALVAARGSAFWGVELALALVASGAQARALVEIACIAADPRRYQDVFYSAAEDALPPGVLELSSNFGADEEAAGLTVALSRAERLHAACVRHTRAYVCVAFASKAALLACVLSREP